MNRAERRAVAREWVESMKAVLREAHRLEELRKVRSRAGRRGWATRLARGGLGP